MDLEQELKADLKKRSKAYNQALKAAEALKELPATAAFNVLENMKEMLREHFHGESSRTTDG